MEEPCGAIRLLRRHHETLPADGRIDAAHGAEIVTAVRTAGRAGLVAPAIELALATWRVLAPDQDRGWWDRLAEAGEDIAIAGHDPRGLVELLTCSGAAYARAGDTTPADDQWRRAFALTHRLGDHERAALLLHRIGDLRRTTGSLGRALTVFFELVRVRIEQGDQLGLAEALTEVGTTMRRAGRREDAEYFRHRAWEALQPGARGPRRRRRPRRRRGPGVARGG